MPTYCGVGFSNLPDSHKAGESAAREALAGAGIDKPDVAFLYSTSKHDPKRLSEGIREIIGPDCRLVGGASVGVISNNKLGYGGHEAGVAVLKSSDFKVDLLLQEGLGTGEEYRVGKELAKKVLASAKGNHSLIVNYDLVRPDRKPLPVNMAVPLIKGMTEGFGGKWPTAVGVGLVGDVQFNQTSQWFNDKVLQQTATAVIFSGNVQMDSIIFHGCKPSSDYHTVTKADGPVILEIDGKPAVEAITEMLGPDSGKTWEDFPLFITLGINTGDKWDDFKEENYMNRLCIAVDKDRGGLVMIEDDIQEGAEIQLMRRTLNDFDYIEKRCDELLKRISGRKPVFAFYLDCAGRAAAYCGADREDAEVVQKMIGSKMPLLGIYSGVELGTVGNTPMQVLDWTGVLSIWSVN